MVCSVGRATRPFPTGGRDRLQRHGEWPDSLVSTVRFPALGYGEKPIQRAPPASEFHRDRSATVLKRRLGNEMAALHPKSIDGQTVFLPIGIGHDGRMRSRLVMVGSNPDLRVQEAQLLGKDTGQRGQVVVVLAAQDAPVNPATSEGYRKDVLPGTGPFTTEDTTAWHRS
jgi:hypothetical protein